jgi:hypothetical protein
VIADIAFAGLIIVCAVSFCVLVCLAVANIVDRGRGY